MDRLKLLTRFKEIFDGEPILFFSPGRVNLIGEHIDYNGGFVFPAAITFGTYAAVVARDDDNVRLFSGNFKDRGILEFSLSNLAHTADEDYSAFAKGVAEQFQKNGFKTPTGFDAYIEGDIPQASGLSSSASFELLVAEILQDLNGLKIDTLQKIKMAQKAENEYVGVNCGIMDQFAIGMGKEGYAIKLNTDDLSYEYAAADLQDCRILIMNTNKKRELAESKYNERRRECEEALNLLKQRKAMTHLCDLTLPEFESISGVLTDKTLWRRARHAVSENYRVKMAIEALAQKDLGTFGKLLDASHQSLREDYEVTGKELDKIVELARLQEGVLGARMTGAGFGGCAIALVRESCLREVIDSVKREYKKEIGYDAEFYVASIGGGTKQWDGGGQPC